MQMQGLWLHVAAKTHSESGFELNSSNSRATVAAAEPNSNPKFDASGAHIEPLNGSSRLSRLAASFVQHVPMGKESWLWNQSARFDPNKLLASAAQANDSFGMER